LMKLLLVHSTLFFLLLICSLGVAEKSIETITVIGKKTSEEAFSTPSEFSGETISIAQDTSSSIVYELENTTAITVRRSGGEGSAPVFLIRGQDSNQNRFYLEGIPITDAQFNASNLDMLPRHLLSQVDLYAGGIPVFLGGDGLGGALNFKLNRPKEKAAAEFGTRVGSYDYLSLFGGIDTRVGVPISVGAEFNRSDEDFTYFDDNGTPFNSSDDGYKKRQNNGFQRFSIVPQALLYRDKNNELRVFGINFFGNREIAGSTQFSTEGKLKRQFLLWALKYDRKLNKTDSFDAHLFWKWDKQKVTDVTSALGNNSLDSESTALGVGAKAHARVLLGRVDEGEAIIGVNVEKYSVRMKAEAGDRADKIRAEIPMGVSAKIYLSPSFYVNPALMAHYYQYALSGDSTFDKSPNPANRSVSYFLLSPRVGSTYYVNPQFRIRSTVGSYYRAPSMYEMYGEPIGITPSQDLTYERSYKGELGFDWEISEPVSFLEALRISYTYSISFADDLIAYIPNTQQTRIATNIGKSVIHSHEILLEGKSHVGISGQVGLTLLKTLNRSDVSYEKGRELPGRPPYRLRLGLGYRSSGFRIGYDVTFFGPTYWDLANTKELSSVTYHSAVASLYAGTLGTFGVEVRNITNVITANSTFGGSQSEVLDNTTGYTGYPAPGRRVYVSWRYQL